MKRIALSALLVIAACGPAIAQYSTQVGPSPASGVTSVICGAGLSGGTITSTGTCAVASNFWQMTLITATQSITGGAGDAIVVFNSKTSGSASFCSTSTGVCTPNVAGTYRVFCQLDNNPGATAANGVLVNTSIYLNSTLQANGILDAQIVGNTVSDAVANTSANVTVNGSTDTISCKVAAAANGAVKNAVTTSFSGNWISP